MVDHHSVNGVSPRRLHRPDPHTDADHAGKPASDNSIVARIIELEIIPGLLSRSRQEAQNRPRHAQTPVALQVSPGMVHKLAELALQSGAPGCQTYVDRLTAQGLEQRSLFGILFANTARLLGRMWEEDECTFVEVTVAISVLQQLIHDNSGDGLAGLGQTYVPIRVLLLPAPREQHIFGILIVAQSLRSSGFDVDIEFEIANADHVLRIVGERPCDCIGFSLSSDRWLEGLTESVSKLRDYAGFGPRPIVLGGPAIARTPERLRALDIDGTAEDETGVVRLLQSLTSARSMSAAPGELAGTG